MTVADEMARLQSKAAELIAQAARRDGSMSPAEDAELPALLKQVPELELIGVSLSFWFERWILPLILAADPGKYNWGRQRIPFRQMAHSAPACLARTESEEAGRGNRGEAGGKRTWPVASLEPRPWSAARLWFIRGKVWFKS
jgi:hypothetical protein